MPEEKEKILSNYGLEKQDDSIVQEIKDDVESKGKDLHIDSAVEKQDFPTYSRTNGESLVDPFAIKSCKNEQNRDIIENGRLGSYDDYGNYIFIPEIRQELIEIPKLIYNTSIVEEKKTYDMRAIIPIFGEMYFKLKINKYEAQLILIENVTREAGQYVEVYEELVDSLALSEKDPIPDEVIFTLFHIFEDDDDYGMEFDAYYGFENILLKKIYMGLLSKEIKQLTASDEHSCFVEMMQIIEESGEYGERIKKEFLTRIRDRRQIFEIKDEYAYDRAVNEILLASIDMATTEKDKENPKTCAVYNKIINVRNKNLTKYIVQAETMVDEQYVKDVKEKAIKSFVEKNYERSKEVKLEYIDRLTISPKKNKKENNLGLENKTEKKKHTLDKPLMKQLTAIKKENEQKNKLLTKEEKIAKIVEKKSENKKETKGEEKKTVKKVAPSKAQKNKAKANKKGSSKGKGKKPGGKKKGKPKVKSDKKVKKPKTQKKVKDKNKKMSGNGKAKTKPNDKPKEETVKKSKGKDKKQKNSLYNKEKLYFLDKYFSQSYIQRDSYAPQPTAILKNKGGKVSSAKNENFSARDFGTISIIYESSDSTKVENLKDANKSNYKFENNQNLQGEAQIKSTTFEEVKASLPSENIQPISPQDIPNNLDKTIVQTLSIHKEEKKVSIQSTTNAPNIEDIVGSNNFGIKQGNVVNKIPTQNKSQEPQKEMEQS